MESERFDAWTRQLATDGTSRRGLLRTLGGGLAGTMLATIGVRGAGAQRSPRQPRPPRGDDGTCRRWCDGQFADRREAVMCLRQAVRGDGPCYGCGGPNGTPCAVPENPCQEAVCDAAMGTCSTRPATPEADQCHIAGTCDPTTGAALPQPYGTSCDDGNPICNSGICCPSSGYVAIHGGCFKINELPDCGDCPSDSCTQDVPGVADWICIGDVQSENCTSNDSCLIGSACLPDFGYCVTPG